MFTSIKLAVMSSVVVVGVGVFTYVNFLRSELQTTTAKNATLTQAVQSQKDTINTIRGDVAKIKQANTVMTNVRSQQQTKIYQLEDKFNRVKRARTSRINKRSFSEIAIKKSKLVERLVNRGTQRVFACLELSTNSKGVLPCD